MNITDKIKAIIAKARSTEHEAEAETLMAKAYKMMQEHQIEAADLADGSDPMGTHKGPARAKSGPSSYKPKLASALAIYYGCRPVWTHAPITSTKDLKSPKMILEVNGPESARITFELMLEYVWDQVVEQAAQLAADGHGDRGQMIRHVTNALLIRVGNLVAADTVRNEPPKTEAGRNALVLVGTGLQLYMDDRYPKLTATKSSHVRWNGHAGAAANKINLARQTTATKQERLN